jgi:hypothetical protein
MSENITLSKAEARELVSEGVKQALTEVGLGGDPLEMQRDMAHLRKWRTSIDAAQSTSFKVIATTLVSGFLGLIWLGVNTFLGR